MKTIFGKLLIAATALLCASGTVNAATPGKTSKLFAYKGSYTGTLVIGGIASLSGPTTGNISSSKKKDIGSLTMTSPVGGGITVTETFRFNNHTFTYLLTTGVNSVGTGSVSIGKKVITYTGTVADSNQIYTINGTARLNKKSLTISEVLSSPSATLIFNYTLRRSGK